MAVSSPNELPRKRLTNLGECPIWGRDLQGAWCDFKRDLSHLGLREITSEVGGDFPEFPIEAVFVDRERGRWFLVRDQDATLRLLSHEVPRAPFEKGDKVYWKGSPARPYPQLIIESVRPYDPEKSDEIWASVLYDPRGNATGMPLKELALWPPKQESSA